MLLHRDGLAADHRFIDVRPAVGDFAVHRDFAAWLHPQHVAYVDVVQVDLFLAAVGLYAHGSVRHQREQCLDRAVGLRAGAQFEHLSHQHQRNDDGGGFEVQRNHAVHFERFGKQMREQQGHQAEQISGGRAQPNQAEHIEVPGFKRRPSADEERPAAPQHHGRCQQGLQPVEGVRAQHMVQIQTGNKLAHGDHE